MGPRRTAAALAVVLLTGGAAPAAAPPHQPAPGSAGCTTTVVAGDQPLADAVAGAGPGDVVCLSGTFDERLLVTRGGSASSPLTIRSLDPSAPAVLRPAGDVPEGDHGVVELRDVAHVRIAGLEITGWVTDELGHTPAGILVTSTGSAAVDGVALVGNSIHDMGHTHPPAFSQEELAGCEGSTAACAGELAGGIQAFGIAVKGRASTPITDLQVVGNALADLSLGGSEALAINGNVEGFTVTGNRISDVSNIAIDAIGFEDPGDYPDGVPRDQTVARGGLIARNRVWHVTSEGNAAYGRYGGDGRAAAFDRSAAAIYLDGARDTVVEGNIVVGADIGVEVAAEFDLGATRDVVVRSNVIARTGFAGIALGGYAEEQDDAGLAPDDAYNGEGDAVAIQVIANTVHTAGGGAALVVQHRVRDTVIAGNILAAAADEIVQGVPADAFEGIERTADLEVVAAAAGDDPDGVFVTAELPTAQALLDGGAALRPFLHLADGSPAIDAGTATTPGGVVLDLGAADVDGDARVSGAVDAGADEVPREAVPRRIAGASRYGTGAAIAAADHPAGADVVVLARADDPADALAAAPVAFGRSAPVLVTDTGALHGESADAIAALAPRTVLLFGGAAALGEAVEAALPPSAAVERIAGPNRYATAAAAADHLAAHGGIGGDGAGRRVAVVAEGGDPRGPLAAGVPAAVGRFPILLADRDRLPEETRTALVEHAIGVVELIGGPDQLSEDVRRAIEQLGIEVRRVAGPTPLDTVAAVARMGADRGLLDGAGAVLGRGDVVVDALTAGPHAAMRRVPILLTDGPAVLGGAARGWLGDPTSPSRGLVDAVGGTAALSDAVLQEAVQATAR